MTSTIHDIPIIGTIGVYLQDLFIENKAIVDDRAEPLMTFQIPTLDGEYGLFAPNMTGWFHMIHVSSFFSLLRLVTHFTTLALSLCFFADTHKHICDVVFYYNSTSDSITACKYASSLCDYCI